MWTTQMAASLKQLLELDGSKRIGVEHELDVLQSLADVPKIMVYHSVHGIVDGDKFEVDLVVVLPSSTLLIVEVKKYGGFLVEGKNERYWEQDKHFSNTTTVKNPVTQVLRTERLFKQFLSRRNIMLKTRPAIVFHRGISVTKELDEYLSQQPFPIGDKDHLKKLICKHIQDNVSKEQSASPLLKKFAQEMLQLGFEPCVLDSKWFFG